MSSNQWGNEPPNLNIRVRGGQSANPNPTNPPAPTTDPFAPPAPPSQPDYDSAPVYPNYGQTAETNHLSEPAPPPTWASPTGLDIRIHSQQSVPGAPAIPPPAPYIASQPPYAPPSPPPAPYRASQPPYAPPAPSASPYSSQQPYAPPAQPPYTPPAPYGGSPSYSGQVTYPPALQSEPPFVRPASGHSTNRGIIIGGGAVAAVAVIILMVVLLAHSGPNLVGTWQYIQPAAAPTPTHSGDPSKDMQGTFGTMINGLTCGMPSRIEFLQDGTFQVSGLGGSGGKYEVNQNQLTFMISGASKVYTISLAGNVLTLHDTNNCTIQYQSQ